VFLWQKNTTVYLNLQPEERSKQAEEIQIFLKLICNPLYECCIFAIQKKRNTFIMGLKSILILLSTITVIIYVVDNQLVAPPKKLY